MKRIHLVGWGVLILVLSSQFPLNAQILGARLEGVVRDPSQSVVPGATVTVTNKETGIARSDTTDAQGRYIFNDLPPARYDVATVVSGFKTTVRSGLTLAIGAQVVVDLALEVGAVAEQVTVTGEAPQVETQTGTVSGVVEEKVIRDLPLNGRSFANLANLSPGVIITKAAQKAELSGLGDKMSLGGARPHQMSFTLDGADLMGKDNSTPAGVSGIMMGVDTIQEFRVSTSSFSSEFGRNSGGVISAISKSGGNKFHGTGFEFLRNSYVDARNFFDRQTSPTAPRLPAFRRNQFGGTVGGRIKKDKTFFFGGYEGLRQALGVSGFSSVPNVQARLGNLPSGPITIADSVKPYLALYPLPNGQDLGGGLGRYTWSKPQTVTQDDYMARIDHQLSSNDSLMGRFFLDNSFLSNYPTAQTGSSMGLMGVTDSARTQSYVADYKRIFGASTVNDFRAVFNRIALFLDDQIPTNLDPLEYIPGRGYGRLEQNGFSSISSQSTNPRFWYQNAFQYIDDAVIAHGRHTLKFGAMAERFQMNEFSVARFRGEYQFTALQTFLTGTPSRLEMGWPNAGTRGLRQWLLGMYFQDDMKVNSRLTLNLGVRYEFTTVPTEVAGRMSTLRDRLASQVTVGDPWWNNPSLKNFAPRVGFAYDLTGNGKTAIRGGFGIFYDQMLSIYWRDSNSRMLPFQSRFVVVPGDPILKGQNIPFPHGYTLFTPGPTLSDPSVELDLAAPFHTNQPYTMQFNLTVQRQLAPDLTLMVGYMGSQSRNNSRNVNWNACAPSSVINGQPFFAAGCQKQNPNFGVVFQHLFDAPANYNSLQVALRKRYSHGLNFDLVYQYAKTMDVMSGIAGSTDFQNTSFSQNPDNYNGDYSRASFDIRHYLTVNATYEIPYQGASAIARQALGGWRISSLTSFSGGEPLTIANGFDRSGAKVQIFGFQERPNLAAGFSNNPTQGTTAGCNQPSGAVAVKAGQKLRTPDLWFDPCAFVLQPAGFFGNLGRNTVQGPNLITEDIALLKDFSLGESRKLEFRWELFNLFNRANFEVPTFTPWLNATTRNANAGLITATRTSSRQMQLGLKIIF